MTRSKKLVLMVISAIALLGSTFIVLSRFSGGADGVENGNKPSVFRDSDHVQKLADNPALRDISAPADETANIEIFKINTDTRPAKSPFMTTDPVSRKPTFRLDVNEDVAQAQVEIGEPADDLAGALEYEFNMTKNPATGKIPEGSYEAELAQANQIVRRQRDLDIPEVGSYSFVGPNNLGGRTRAIAYDVRYNGTSNRIILACGVTGGVYKSIDDGATWVRKSPLGEHFSCTSIAQDQRAGFQDTWYYSVGELSGSGGYAGGNGVYKSTNNGETWLRLPNSNTSPLETFTHREDFISKVVVDATAGAVYIACVSGIKRSTDGGATWGTVLAGSLSFTSVQFTDIVVTSTGRLYAAFGGTNSADVDGVWTSTSGAVGSWTRIAGGGTPVGWKANNTYGRVVLAIAPINENLVYALYDNGYVSGCIPPGIPGVEAALFRWDFTMSAWTDLSATLPDEPGCATGIDPFTVQGGYDLVVAVKPDDPTVVFIGGTNIYRSTTSGTSWTRIGGYGITNTHPDIHSIVFQPTSSSVMLCGNDGGIQRTTDDLAATVAWTQINTGFRTFQYYHVAIDPRSGNTKVIGGAQDNGTTRNIVGMGTSFQFVGSGDGVSVGLSDPNVTGGIQYEYYGEQNGYIIRSGTNIRPSTATATGLFVTVFKLDPDNTERLYYANYNSFYRTNTASTVTPTSGWTNMTGVAAAVGSGSSIIAIAPSRGAYNAATSSLFLGTNTGQVFRLDDPTGAAATAVPVNITGAGFPPGGYVSSISCNPTNDDTVLVTFANYGVTSVFWTGNANAAAPTWTAVEGALTLPSYRSSAIIDLPFAGLQYFVGTSAGLYNTGGLPGSPAWTQEGPGSMGNALVSSLDLRASDRKLLVGTHGYGMWSTSIGGVYGLVTYILNLVISGPVIIPINVGDLTGLGAHSYDFQITFDPAIVQPASLAFDTSGTLSSGMSVTADATNPGHLIISASQSPDLVGSGTLLNLNFNVIGSPGQSSTLAFEDYTDLGSIFHPGFRFNDGDPPVAAINGSVTIPAGTISGTVKYGNAAAPPKYISNVTVTGTGSPTVTTTTDAPGATAGQYTLTGFGSSSYTVSLSKTAGQNGINSFDAARVAQHVANVGPGTFTNNNQKVTADVSGNGVISSNDAAKIAQVVAGLPLSSPNLTGTWQFYVSPGPTFPVGASPTSRTYASVTTNLTGEDYVGLLIGEVTGNWTPSAARPAAEPQNPNWRSSEKHSFSANRAAEPSKPVGSGPERGIAVELPQMTASTDKEIVIPVAVNGAAGKEIISYEFNLRYDPSVIQPQENPVDLAGTASLGLSVVANPSEPGLLRVVVYGAMPIDGDGLLLNLRFKAVGAAGSVSPLTFERIMFNEGESETTAIDGQVEITLKN